MKLYLTPLLGFLVLGQLCQGEIARVQKPSFLFIDLVDAADCLGDLDPEDPVDVGRWTAIVTLEKEKPVPNCASCYGHVDGNNIIGVLPVIKDTLREPFLVHSPKLPPENKYHYENHGPDWFWTISKVTEFDPSMDVSSPTSGLEGLYSGGPLNTVTSDDILALVRPEGVINGSFDLPSPSDASSVSRLFGSTDHMYPISASPFTQGIGGQDGELLPGSKLNPSSYLVVPDTIRPLPSPQGPFPEDATEFASYYALPYPQPAFIAANGALLDSQLTSNDPSLLDSPNRSNRMAMALGPVLMGSLVSRGDPPLPVEMIAPNTQAKTPISFPAYQYYDSAHIRNAKNLQLCGVDYEVVEYGSVYQLILQELDDVLARHTPTPTGASYWLDQNGNAASGTTAYFSGVTGFWTGKDLD